MRTPYYGHTDESVGTHCSQNQIVLEPTAEPRTDLSTTRRICTTGVNAPDDYVEMFGHRGADYTQERCEPSREIAQQSRVTPVTDTVMTWGTSIDDSRSLSPTEYWHRKVY